MTNLLKSKRKDMEILHRQLIGRDEFEPDTYIPLENRPVPRVVSVSVTTYGAYEKPIEGWNTQNAKLGRSS